MYSLLIFGLLALSSMVFAESSPTVLMNPTLKGVRMSAKSGAQLKGICVAKGFSDFQGDSVVFSDKEAPTVAVDEEGETFDTPVEKYVTRITCLK